MMTSYELEARARHADMQGDEARADHLYRLANEAWQDEDDMTMSIPRHERYDHENAIERRRHWRM